MQIEEVYAPYRKDPRDSYHTEYRKVYQLTPTTKREAKLLQELIGDLKATRQGRNVELFTDPSSGVRVQGRPAITKRDFYKKIAEVREGDIVFNSRITDNKSKRKKK